MLSSIYSALTEGPSVRVKSDKESTTVPVLKVFISRRVGAKWNPNNIEIRVPRGTSKVSVRFLVKASLRKAFGLNV